MTLVDNFKNGIKQYIEDSEWKGWDKNEFVKELGIKNIKFAFLSEVIFGITTYDIDLDIEFGRNILEIMEVISNRENYDYIKYRDNKYKKFIIVANLLDEYGWIEWGTSIRGCWFSPNNPTIHEELDNYNMTDIKFDYEGKEINMLIKYLKSEEL